MQSYVITFNDVERVVIESKCHDFCTHSACVTLKGGRTRAIPPLLIHAVISQLAEERINSNLKWKGAEVKIHFNDHSLDQWTEKASLKILNLLFSEK